MIENNLYSKMINAITRFEKKYTDETEVNCIHDLLIFDNGFHVCRSCGEVQDKTEFCAESNDVFYTSGFSGKSNQRYNKAKHFTNKIQRLSGYFYPVTKEININDVPSDMRSIRKYLKKNKLHPKNDFYFWRLKNNIKAEISKNLEIKWVTEFKKQRLSAKKFLYNKFLQFQEFNVFLQFFEQKTIKKIQ
jgi:hypothetical protein